MIIFVNGSFGSGKTSVAKLLVDKIPDSLLYDPEEVGFMLRAILSPIDWSGDFQDYPTWRRLVPEVGRQLAGQYGRTLIVPMTIWREDYFKEVTEGFRCFDPDFRHFCLTAPLAAIHGRIRARGEQEEGHWVYMQAEKCVEAFRSEVFEERIETAAMGPEQVADHIISYI